MASTQQSPFVSVTQQFNTTSSMGRLTLNVLLSFAQFEREVTAERIRDKIAASKKKGLWTGGPVPLGYDVIDKALQPNPVEAETVRRLFQLYLTLGSVRELQDAATAEGIVTKRRKGVGARAGGNQFSRGALYALLSNQTYAGRIAYRGEVYEGQHEPIVDLDLWDAVQAKLKDSAPKRRSHTTTRSAFLLAGLIYDETGDRLTPSHANKGGKRYRYYVSNRLHLAKDRTGWRLPAPMLENMVLDVLDRGLAKPAALPGSPPKALNSVTALEQLQAASKELRCELKTSNSVERALARVEVRPSTLRITLKLDALIEDAEGGIEIEDPIVLRRRGVETKLVLATGEASETHVDVGLMALVAKAHRWRDLLVSGRFQTMDQLAISEGVSRWDVSRHLPLAFLAPDIVDAILAGRQPVELTVNRLKRALPLPLCWSAQRRLLGFGA